MRRFLLLALLLAFPLAARPAAADCANPYLGAVGGSGTGLGLFTGPQRVGTDLAGDLFVVDTGNSRIEKLTLATSAWSAFGSAGTGTGQFSGPRAVAVDSLGNVYVADTNNNRVQKFNASFAYVTSWGSAGSGNGQFNAAQGIAIDPTNSYVYVAEYGNGRIQKFTTAGAYVTQWASASATDVACDRAGNVYVSSYAASHVTKYSSTGTVLATIGSAGTGNGQLSGAQGVAVDHYGNLYVTDGGNLRLEKFNTAGTWLANVGTGQFTNIFGVAVDTSGVVWAPDINNNRILQYAPTVFSVTATNNLSQSYGQNPVWFAQYAPTTATGTLELFDGASEVAQTAMSGGSGALTYVLPGAGTHTLVVQAFNGGTCAGATSAAGSLLIFKVTPGFSTLSATPAQPGASQIIKFSVGLADLLNGGGVPTGTVHLLIDGSAIVYGPLQSGGLTFSTGIATAGSHTWAFQYDGDADFNALASSAMPMTISPLVPMPSPAGVLDPGTIAGPEYYSGVGIAFDAVDDAFVTDYLATRILEFSRLGVLLRTFGSPGSGNGQLTQPMGIAVDGSGNVFVVDQGNARVEVFSATGVYLNQWGGVGSGNGQFTVPSGIAVDALGDVYVVDRTNRIQEFTNSGAFIRSWNTGDGNVSTTMGLAIRPMGDVLYGDFVNSRVQDFTNSGTLVSQFGSHGNGPGQFGSLADLALDGFGHIWTSDDGWGAVSEFDSVGTLLGHYYLPGIGMPGAARIDHSGYLYVSDLVAGSPLVRRFALPPAITSVQDVPGDQGGQVRLHLTPNNSDFAGAAFPTTGYQVYRRLPAGSAPARAARAAPDGVRVAGWDYVLTVPATADTAYNVVVPTLADSGATGPNVETFFVRAATATPSVYTDSAPDSGYAVDNLPPPVPAPFLAAYTAGATHLHWGASSASDFWYFRLYRSASAGFTPAPANQIASTADTAYVDAGAAGAYYQLTAVDVNGNESAAAAVTPAGTSGVAAAAPLAFALAPPRPNPAHAGAVTLECSLASAAPARLELLDVAGRVVEARGLAGVGRHAVALTAGGRLAPGLYLARLTQGGERRVQRVAVVE